MHGIKGRAVAVDTRRSDAYGAEEAAARAAKVGLWRPGPGTGDRSDGKRCT